MPIVREAEDVDLNSHLAKATQAFTPIRVVLPSRQEAIKYTKYLAAYKRFTYDALSQTKL